MRDTYAHPRMAQPRRRLDAELVRRRLVSSREAAQAAIERGGVLVGGTVAEKASRLVGAGEAVELVGPKPRFVSRGGEKLDHALNLFEIDVMNAVALDAGASTGGFTDCLLQRGAQRVVAVDVGRGQMHERMRADHRVAVHEQTNLRVPLLAEALGRDEFDIVVVDVSFISLTVLAEVLVGFMAPQGLGLVALVKPQFEAGRIEVSRGQGVVRSPEIWGRTVDSVRTAMERCGAAMMGLVRSPITGADGNVEFLAYFLPTASRPE